jgi:predicted nucleotidyltransferase
LPQANALWLFGSAARHELRADSDIDLAVTLPTALQSAEKLRVTTALSTALGRDVDLLDFSRLPTVMQFQVLETGQLLYTDNAVKTETYSAFVRTEYQHIQRWREPMIAQLTRDLAQI